MYVIVEDNMPDITVSCASIMNQKLLSCASSKAYQYYESEEGIWHVKFVYYTIEDNEIVFAEAGTWNCDEDYLVYDFPNSCLTCKNTEFMQGTSCMLCSGDYDDKECPDCGRHDTCECKYTDF